MKKTKNVVVNKERKKICFLGDTQIRRVFNLLEQRLKGDNKNEKILERLDQYRAKEIDALW